MNGNGKISSFIMTHVLGYVSYLLQNYMAPQVRSLRVSTATTFSLVILYWRGEYPTAAYRNLVPAAQMDKLL
jgi:hypothetical protein